jgi:serine/threonine protein kinase
MTFSIAIKGVTLYLLTRTTLLTALDDRCSKEHEDLKLAKEWIGLPDLKKTKNLIELFHLSLTDIEQGEYSDARMVRIGTNSEIGHQTNFSIRRAVKSEDLEKELKILETLSDTGAVPQLYACVLGNENDVYILEELFTQRLQYTSVITAIKQKSAKEAIRFFKTGFDALKKIHERGIVHNDITPASMMADNDFGKIVFTKWEVAQFMGETNNNFGTPLYMNFLRRSQTNCNPVNDLYMFALSIVLLYSNHDFVFSNVSQNKFEIKAMTDECFKSQKSENFFNSKIKSVIELEEFCLRQLELNAAKVMSSIFGNNQNLSKDSKKMNFSTLISKIINYKKSGITLDQIWKAVENFDQIDNNSAIESPFPLSKVLLEYSISLAKTHICFFDDGLETECLSQFEEKEEESKNPKALLDYFEKEIQYLKRSKFLQKYPKLNKRFGKTEELIKQASRIKKSRVLNLRSMLNNHIGGRRDFKGQSISHKMSESTRNLNLYNLSQVFEPNLQRSQSGMRINISSMIENANKHDNSDMSKSFYHPKMQHTLLLEVPLKWNDESIFMPTSESNLVIKSQRRKKSEFRNLKTPYKYSKSNVIKPLTENKTYLGPFYTKNAKEMVISTLPSKTHA